MRMLVIKQNTDAQALNDQLLKAKLSGVQSEAAMSRLQALNPHVDLTQKLRAGTVLLVPDAPSFKATATDAVQDNAFEDFQKLVKDNLGQASSSLKAGNRVRTSERADVSAAFKTSEVMQAIAKDPELKKQIEDAAEALNQDQQEDKDAEQAVSSAGKAALAKLAELGKLLS
jgi:hypothetical protein